jgi:hypothetical protein
MNIASLQTAVDWQSWRDSTNGSMASAPNQGGNGPNPAGRNRGSWREADLLVLDDLPRAPHLRQAGELLRTLVHQRYKLKRSIVVTKHLGDHTMASTILDRLMHRARLTKGTPDGNLLS